MEFGMGNLPSPTFIAALILPGSVFGGRSNPHSADSKFFTNSSTSLYGAYYVYGFQYLVDVASIVPIISIVSRLSAAKLPQEQTWKCELV